MDEFNCRTRIISGTGTVRRLEDFGAKRLFLVTDPYFYENGTAKRVAAEAKAGQVEIFHEVKPDPTVELAAEGTARLRAFHPDLIVALGGGSAMDCAKAMAYFAKEDAKLVAIPTTSGSGSEVTDFAILTHNKVKHPLVDKRLRPDAAILDSELLQQLPPALVADAGFDVIAHALEAYAAMLATDYTDGLALKSLKTIFQYLPRAYEHGQTDVEAREKMANAATMAGMAFANAFLGVCHSMAHKLGAFHHLPHGVANALMIEEVLRFNAAEAPAKMGTFSQYDHPHTLSRYAEVADYLGVKAETDEEKLEGLIAMINDLKHKVGIKDTIAEYGIDEATFLAQLDEMVEQAFDDQCTGANPRYPLMSEIKQMYLNAYYGKKN